MLDKRLNNNFFKKGISIILLRGGGILLSFGLLLFITNLFEDELVGKYQYFNSFLIVTGTIALLGLNVSFIRFSGELKASGQKYLLKNLYYRNVMILLISVSMVAFFYFIASLFLVPNYISVENHNIYQLVLLTVFPNCLMVLNFQVLLGLERLYLSELFRNIIKFTVIGSFILGVYVLKYYNELLPAFVLAIFFIAIFSTIVVLKVLERSFTLNAKISKEEKYKISLKKILIVSFPMTLSSVSLLLMQHIDLMILKNYSPYEELAYYGTAVKVSMILSIVLTAVNQVIATQLSELFYKKDKKGLRSVVNKAILLNNIITIPFVILIFLLPETILSFFGENYVNAKGALLILICGQALNAFSGSTDLYLNMTGKQKYFQKIILIALLLNISLNFLLIPKFGIEGAAVSTAISLVFWNVLGVIYVYRKDKIILTLNIKMLREFIKR